MEAMIHVEKFLTEQQKKQTPAFHLSVDATNTKTILTIQALPQKSSGEITLQKFSDSEYAKKTTLTSSQSNQYALISAPRCKDAALAPLLCYFALRQARLWGCLHVLTEETLPAFFALSPVSTLPRFSSQKISSAIFHAYQQCDAAQRAFIQPYFIREVMETFQGWLNSFFHGSWFNAVASESITQTQYIATLFHAHQFVRYTTRLAARCVTLCDNHELIIESDLKALKADVAYLLNDDVPNAISSEFMVVQEAVTAYRQDPVLMLACPFAAEGMTANISHDFVDHLHAAIQSWGIAAPAESVS